MVNKINNFSSLSTGEKLQAVGKGIAAGAVLVAVVAISWFAMAQDVKAHPGQWFNPEKVYQDTVEMANYFFLGAAGLTILSALFYFGGKKLSSDDPPISSHQIEIVAR